jgi:phosphate transport system permease protein
VHYEGYGKPEYVYQSSAGTDEAEPKLSLTPLVFGTLKGTFYAMVFALPLALLAALYTARFMHPRVRAVVKPTVESMASLPSVVLGFVAQLVIAPFVADVVPAVLAAFVWIPLIAFVVGAAWHGLPDRVKHGVSSAARLGLALALVAGVTAIAYFANGPIQRAFFSGPENPAGDFRKWLLGEPGTGSGLPLLRAGMAFLGAALGMWLVPKFAPLRLEGGAAARAALKTLAYAVAPACVFALLAGPVEALLFGGDFRWSLVGRPDGRGTEFQQSNSLVVGIAMGFAVIPIIYTIAEDALSAIPESLTSAALACGASPWQTAVRVVVPAAAPGLFSASMIGLGRAVGETMIVLMATGGTAIMDWSMFNGFRTLSANVATELSEAPRGETLYRVLFLAALLLFAMTFVVNTIAEIVRLRFRRRFKLL